ncbi:MAG: type IV pilus assembly protein PilM [Acidimicrobiia bacterium]
MARRLIGLDIGTNAVTVTEIEAGAPPILRAFGQVALPRDAMRDGEIVDPAAVTAAIRRLWKEVGLKKLPVRVGLATPRLIVRPVELPAMSDEDLAGALRFQAQELIPIPMDEAAVDFQVLETGRDGEGQPTSRVLLAAAHRDTVARLVSVVQDAGLTVEAVDLVPLALIRSLSRRPGASSVGGAEAIVCVGAGVTVVVVHEGGVPRFARVLGVGGRALTEAIATDLDLAFDAAEALKRQSLMADDDLGVRARAAIERPLAELLEEIRGSLDFYRTQPDSPRIVDVLVNGGSSQLPMLAERLGSLLALPVGHADARSALTVGDIGFTPSEYPLLDPYLSVPVGLALGGTVSTRTINLLPGEVRAAATRRRSYLMAGAAVLAAVLGLGYLTYRASSDRSDANDALAEQQQTNQNLQHQLDALADVQAKAARVQVVNQQLNALLATDVAWSTLLTEIAQKIPENDWLTAFQGSSSAGTTSGGTSGATAPAAPTTTTPPTTASTVGPSAPAGSAGAGSTTTPAPTFTGTLSFTVVGRDFPDVSKWIESIGDIQGTSDLWVPNSTKAQIDSSNIVNFSSTASLTEKAKSNRADMLRQWILGATP